MQAAAWRIAEIGRACVVIVAAEPGIDACLGLAIHPTLLHGAEVVVDAISVGFTRVLINANVPQKRMPGSETDLACAGVLIA
jgi:hypothetical protein